jgi:Ser/Thr protein kinase RdoA (MazF antagonist)
LWPDRDDRGRDLSTTPGPTWVDDAARSVRERLCALAAPARIGHGDWESQNISWTDGRPLAVHDWDSVIAQPEAAVVGLAAAVWPAAGAPGEAATVEQTEDFIVAYQRAAGRQWTEPEIQDAWAAGLWVRLFNAKKDATDGGGPQLDRLVGEVGGRLARAAITDQAHQR